MKHRLGLFVLLTVLGLLGWPLAPASTGTFLARAAAQVAQNPGDQANLRATISTTPANPAPGAAVVIKVNLENSGAVAATNFWVELFVNPKQVPAQANQSVESNLAPVQKISWEITQELAAGASLTLTSDPNASSGVTPRADYTEWRGSFLPGSDTVGVYVDSFSEDGSANGAVVESNEQDNSASLQLTAGGGGSTTVQLFLPTLSKSVGVPESGFGKEMTFRPKPDGFSFENYSAPQDKDSALSPNDMVGLFGREAVCENAASSDTCILTGPARQWRDKQVADLSGGQCYGMAVAASRFYGKVDSPATFTPGAAATFDIQKTTQLESHIAALFVTQMLEPKNTTGGGFIKNKKPSEYLQLLREAFTRNESYVFGFFKRDGGAGHAVTPYAIKDLGGGIVRLYIYDNNWPGVERYFEFDTNRETWKYDFGATNPEVPADVWEGDERTNSLDIRSVTATSTNIWQCPFCQGTPVAGVAQAISDTIRFDFGGEGRMLVIDPSGKRVGYNPATRKSLNEISGAAIIPFRGGLGKEIPPSVEITYTDDLSSSYQVVLSGNELEAASAGDLTISVDGFVVGFSNVQLPVGAEITVTARADLQQLKLTSNVSGTFSLFIAEEPEADAEDSYIVEVADVDLAAGDELTMEFSDDDRLLVRNSSGQTVSYDISYIRIDETAGDEEWSQDDYSAGDDDFLLDFEEWDGTDADDVPGYIDDEGNGFDDDTPEDLGDE